MVQELARRVETKERERETMQHYSLTFRDEEGFKLFIENNALSESRGLLQVLSGRCRQEVEPILRLLKNHLPDFSVFGASTAGEIAQGRTFEGSLLLNFMVFEKGTIASLIRLENHTLDHLSVLKEELAGLSPEVMIMYINPLDDCPEKFVSELKQRLPTTLIACRKCR